MKAIDDLDRVVTLILSWLRSNPNIKLIYSQKVGLKFIVCKIVEGGKTTHDEWNRIRPKIYKIDSNSPINDLNVFINQIATWLIDNPGNEISKVKGRLSALLSHVNKREEMTYEEEQKIWYELREKMLEAIKRTPEYVAKEKNKLYKEEAELKKELAEVENRIAVLKSQLKQD
jgi:hypothetical protein